VVPWLRKVGESSARVQAQRSWRSVSVRGSAPAAAAFARVVVHADRHQGAVWLDDVSFGWLPGDDVGGAAGDQRVEDVGRVDAA
jgi:hypothetical protein